MLTAIRRHMGPVMSLRGFHPAAAAGQGDERRQQRDGSQEADEDRRRECRSDTGENTLSVAKDNAEEGDRHRARRSDVLADRRQRPRHRLI